MSINFTLEVSSITPLIFIVSSGELAFLKQWFLNLPILVTKYELVSNL